MEKNFDINEQGYSVRCKLLYNKDPHAIRHVVIVTHGFGGSKENKSTVKFADRLTSKYKGYGVICFDWPCHGADARKKLVLAECMTYLTLVINYAKKEMQAESVCISSVSFGGYLTLKYMAEIGNPFRKVVLRCPSIRMYAILNDHTLTEEDRTNLAKGREILIGHDRMMKIDRKFVEELQAGDLMQYSYLDYADDILMIHGRKDEMVPIADSEAFADANVIELIEVEKGDHRFSNPDALDLSIMKTVEFFAPGQ